uniref:EGF-like domain-containing protein n=1 Tax=Heterorhabditis bacteriophora TaxID=37862 RepID=A0A1I7XRP4_HETBA
MGISCATCDPSYGRDCELPVKRRGAVNSRLTLSGLSFCMITIGLLCVTARWEIIWWLAASRVVYRRVRRRAGVIPPNDDTWYRVFQPTQSRSARHDFMCGGAWIPRDRALLVAPGRAAVVHGMTRTSSRSRRLATPPPSYTSVDNLTDDQMPPSYDEATRILEDRSISDPVIEELIDETATEAKEDTPETTERVDVPNTGDVNSNTGSSTV